MPRIAIILTEGYADWECAFLNGIGVGKPVAAICGGTLAFVRAGLLNDKRHTSNAPHFLSENAKTYKGATHYVDQVTAIVERNVITALGNAPAHFSAAVFRAVEVDEKTVSAFLKMLSVEHPKADFIEGAKKLSGFREFYITKIM